MMHFRRKSNLWWLLAVALSVTVLSLGIGSVIFPPGETLKAIFTPKESRAAFIVWEYRVPRALLAWLVGSSLGISGSIIQSVAGNALAAPDTLGVTAGAGLSAVLLLTFFPGSPVGALPVAAFAGGVGAAAVVYVLAYRHGVTPARLAVVGVAVSALFGSGIKYVVTKAGPKVSVALVWLTGSLWGRGWDEVTIMAVAAGVLLPFCLLMASRLDTLVLGDETAAGLGLPVQATRLTAVLLAVSLASIAASVSGTIGFVGLVAPHAARRLVGARHRFLFLASALVGSLLLILADTAGRGLLPPWEIPAGVATAIVGAPYFLYLLGRNGGRLRQ